MRGGRVKGRGFGYYCQSVVLMTVGLADESDQLIEKSRESVPFSRHRIIGGSGDPSLGFLRCLMALAAAAAETSRSLSRRAPYLLSRLRVATSR